MRGHLLQKVVEKKSIIGRDELSWELLEDENIRLNDTRSNVTTVYSGVQRRQLTKQILEIDAIRRRSHGFCGNWRRPSSFFFVQIARLPGLLFLCFVLLSFHNRSTFREL